MATTAETLRLSEEWRRTLAAITDDQARDLTAAWVAAWDEVHVDLDDAVRELLAQAKDGRVTTAQALKSVRLRNALTAITDRLKVLAADTNTRVVADLRKVIADAGTTQVSLALSQLPPEGALLVTQWSAVDADAIDAIVRRSTGQIESSTRPLAGDAGRVVRRELMRGVAVGENPNETARRIVARTQGGFDGGLARAVRIARTETLDASREAARLADRRNADVLSGWTWVASLSDRTCPACWSMAGSVHPVDEAGPLGHPNCRCTRSPVTRSWADLGFEGMDEPASLLPDPAASFASLTPEQQDVVLGRAGGAAYRDGRWPMEQWSQRRSTSGWRDSYVAARPPAPRSPSSSARLAS